MFGGDPITGQGECQNFANWVDIVVPYIQPACGIREESPIWGCTSVLDPQGANCRIKGSEACCICGGGTRNRPLRDPRKCSLTLIITQLTPAERWRATEELAAGTRLPDPYNRVPSRAKCSATLQLPRAVVDIRSALSLDPYEQHQTVSFSFVATSSDASRIFSEAGMPRVNATTGVCVC